MAAAIFDIDKTLSDAAWRDRLYGEWDEYHRLSPQDKPIGIGVSILNALADSGLEVVLMTGRPERWRGITMDWLLRHGVQAQELIMRPDDDYRRSPELKVGLAEDRFGEDLRDLVLVVDDREDVLEAFASRGVTTIHVRHAS
jgi:phosphoglycolate phosphatase-like HAD superfamily hydrolase